MRTFNKCLGLLLGSVMLASCGGGGGSGGNGAFQPTPSGTLEVRAGTTQLPLNRDGVGPFFGSPYMTEVDIIWRRANGDLVSGLEVAVSINPVAVAAFSTLDDPTTEIELDAQGNYLRGNEFLDYLGSGPVDVTGGHATVFVHSDRTAGTATLTVTARDTGTNTTISKTLNFTVNNVAPPLPASVVLTASSPAVYLQNSGGATSTVVSAVVRDGGGQLIPNPTAGNTAFNNVQFDIVGDAGRGSLSALGAAGPVSGTSVKTRTIQGGAAASFSSGTTQGPIQIRATVDRSDNNVDNGISDPLGTVTTVVVSDGRLYSIQLASPILGGLDVNEFLDCCDDQGDLVLRPDGTYSATVVAVAQDRQGNPVIPGTMIRFGSIDHPVGAYNATVRPGQFLIAGGDGNPQEGGTLFTAPTGAFRTAGGGAGPGDALLVFGKEVQGNEDLESALTIQTVNSETSMTLSSSFNLNNTTGVSVNYGNVLPYVAGRSLFGNITRVIPTDNDLVVLPTDVRGRALVKLNYPVSSLGRPVLVWAQGEAVDPVTSGVRRVTDVAQMIYAGAAPGSISVSPNPILGNRTQTVQVCVVDARGEGLQFLPISFQMQLNGGTGSVDGNGTSGVLDNLTGPEGCVNATVVTSGMAASSSPTSPSGEVVFSLGDLEGSVDIVVNVALLQVSPQSVLVNSDPENTTITVRTFDSGGVAVGGVIVSGTCTASGGTSANITLNPTTATTNSTGVATFIATSTGFRPTPEGPGGVPPEGPRGTGQCTFTAIGGLSGTVTFNGTTCGGFSPPCP